MLFSNIDRTFDGPKPYAEPDYDYIDRSARPEASLIRAVLDHWFAQYPDSDRADLLGWFTSPDDLQHISAAFELYLHELSRRLGYSIQIHPKTSSAKATRPDFLLQDTDGNRVYVEAVQSTDVSTEERGARARLDTVYDAINRLEVYGWFLNVRSRSYPEKSPSASKLRDQLKRWLDGLDPDQVTESVQRNGRESLPTFVYEEGEWRLDFRDSPLARKA